MANMQAKRKSKRPTSRRPGKHTPTQIGNAPRTRLLESTVTIQEFRQLPVWNLAEFTQLCCGAPTQSFDPRRYTITRDIIKRAVLARKVPTVYFRPADPVEAHIGHTFYETDMFFERDNPEVIAWARQTFPAFPADAFAVQPANHRDAEPDAKTGLASLEAAIASAETERDARQVERTKFIDARLAAKGLTVAWLAARSGIDRGNIYRWMSGQTKKLGPKVRGKLAPWLGVPIDQFPD